MMFELSMEVQIGLFCALFAVVASGIIYSIIQIYSVKEDSFDEAKANRRKSIKDFIDQNRSNNEKSKKNKTKKNMKKSKEKKVDEPKPEDVEERIVDEVQEIPKKGSDIKEEEVKREKKMDKEPAKSHGKAQTKEKQEMVAEVIPEPRKETVKKNPDKGTKLRKPETEEETVEVPAMAQSQFQPQPAKENEKKTVKVEKKKKGEGANLKGQGNSCSGSNINTILSSLQKAELSRSEIQLLVDTLLNTYQDEASQWYKVKKIDSNRPDTVVKLKKNLADTEQALKNEKQITSGLQAKLKELRSELVSDKASVGILNEALNKLNKEKDEINIEKTELSYKLKGIIEEKDKAIRSLEIQIGTLTSQILPLEDEKRSLQCTISNLEHEFQAHQMCQVRINDFDSALKSLQEKLKEKEREAMNANMKLETVNNLLEKINSENANLHGEIKALHEKLDVSSQEINTLEEVINSQKNKPQNDWENGDSSNGHDAVQCRYSLEEKDNIIKELESEVEYRSKCVKDLTQTLKESTTKADGLKKLFDEINSDYTSLKLKWNKTNQRNIESEEAIQALRNSINEKTIEFSAINEELEKYKQRNNELRNKNWKVVEALSSAEKALQEAKAEQLEKSENAINGEELSYSINNLIHRLIPNFIIPKYKGHFKEWLEEVEERVASHNLKSTSEDLQAQNLHLQSLVVHYKNIISDTEDMLNRLQKHVEIEETKWSEEISTLRKQLETANAPKNNVQ